VALLSRCTPDSHTATWDITPTAGPILIRDLLGARVGETLEGCASPDHNAHTHAHRPSGFSSPTMKTCTRIGCTRIRVIKPWTWFPCNSVPLQASFRDSDQDEHTQKNGPSWWTFGALMVRPFFWRLPCAVFQPSHYFPNCLFDYLCSSANSRNQLFDQLSGAPASSRTLTSQY